MSIVSCDPPVLLASASLAPASDATGSHAPLPPDEPNRILLKPLVSFSPVEVRALIERHFGTTLEVVQSTESVMHVRRVHGPTLQQRLQLIVVMFASPTRMPYVCPGNGTWSFATLDQLRDILRQTLLAAY